jgi:YteA family regulatory protein
MKEEYQKLKDELLKEKEEILHQLRVTEGMGLEEGYASQKASGELSQYDNHPADEATALYEREKDFVLRELREEQLQDIEVALEKMEKGTYGIDEETGETISLERLEALPTARTVKKNTPNTFVNHDRPIEEQVLRNMEKEYATNSQETEFNEQNAYDIVASFNQTSMTYDDSSLMDSFDGLGYVSLVEAIGATGIEGYTGDENVQVVRNIQYDQWMNQENVAEEDLYSEDYMD